MTIKRSSSKLHLITGLSGVAYITLMILGWQQLPTGYLHSWNQTTTLAMAKAIRESTWALLYPQDVTVLVSWPSFDIKQPQTKMFLVFEEFPLYHLVSSLISRLGISLEVSAKILSSFFSFACVWALVLLVAESSDNLSSRAGKQVTAIFLLTSFPFLYYSQAAMSDLPMTAMGSCSLLFLNRWTKTGRSSTFFLSMALFCIATLLKSYWAIFIVTYVYSIKRFGKGKREVFAAALAVVPVAAWHIYGVLMGGRQEASSHSLENKISSLSWDFLLTLCKQISRFFSWIDILVLIAALLLIFRQYHKTKSFKAATTWWLVPWIINTFFYFALTAEKLLDHDYYFLPLLPALLLVSASMSFRVWEKFSEWPRILNFLLLLMLVDIGLTTKDYLKAIRPNPDVYECANEIERVTGEDDLIAVFSTSNRFNALHYYSDRKGFFVESPAVSVSQYASLGAKYLVINATETEGIKVKESLTNIPPISTVSPIYDFKRRARECLIYDIESLNVPAQ